MGEIGGLLSALGLMAVGLAWFLRRIGRHPPLLPNPRVSKIQLEEARRADEEIDTILVPLVYRFGWLASIVGFILMLVDASF